MRAFHKILLTSAAALSLTTAAAVAQDSESTNILGSTLDSVTGTVSSTVDNVTGTVEGTVNGVVDSVDSTVGTSLSDTVGGVTNSGSVTGGDASGSVGDVSGTVGDLSNSVGDVGQLDFSNVLSSISAGGNNVGDLGTITDVADLGDVQVVDVADIANFDANALNDALSGNSSNITGLQDAINGNSVLTGLLSANSIDVSDVIALSNDQNGSLTFYTYNQD